MNAPMLIPFIAIACGIIVAGYSNGGYWIGAISCLIGSSIYFYLILLRKKPLQLFRYSSLHYCWIFAYFLGIGAILGENELPYIPSENELKNSLVAEGVIDEIKNATSGDVALVSIYSLYDYKGDRTDYHNFQIICKSDIIPAREGDVIAFSAKKLRLIKDSPNSFHEGYAASMNQRGIYCSAQVKEADIRKIKSGSFSLFLLSRNIRDNFVIFLEKLQLKKATRDFIITILTGDRSYMDMVTRKVFSEAGIAHILALSGMHIAIIAGVFLFLLFPLNFLGKYKLRYFLTALLLWIYAFITGMSPSIVRACIMSTAFIVALILERKNTALNSLCLAGFIILVFSPRAIFDIGFQLSFLCVAGLILFAGKLNPIDHRKHPRLYGVISLLNASLIATFISWVLVAYYFNTFPTFFLPANILILPLLPFYIVVILIFILLNLCGVQIHTLGNVIDYCYEMMFTAIKEMGGESVVHLNVSSLSVALWLIGVIYLAIYLYRKRSWWVMCTAVLFFTSSLSVIFCLSESMKRGLLICNTYPEVTLKVSDGIAEDVITIPANTISLHEAYGYGVMVINQRTLPEDICLKKTPSHILITGKYKGTVKEITDKFKSSMIITHSSIRKARERELMEEAKSLNKPLHSLRKQNALKLLEE